MIFTRHIPLKDLDVFPFIGSLVVIVAHQTRGLQAMDERVLSWQLPIKGYTVLIVIPPAIKPDGTNRAIACEELGQLPIHEVVILRPILLLGIFARVAGSASGGIIITRPVDVAVIKVQCDVIVVAGTGKLSHDVLSVGSMHDVVVARSSVPHRETIVVSCGESDVACPGGFDGFHPGIGIKGMRIESIGSFGILSVIDIGILHIPLALSENRVNSPMQEDAKSVGRKGTTAIEIFGRGLIMLCCGGRCPEQQSEEED